MDQPTGTLPLLSAPNAEAARGFYAAVLACELEERTLSEHRAGFACVRDGVDLAHIVQAQQSQVVEEAPASWLVETEDSSGNPVLPVADLDAAIAAAQAYGGELLAPPADGTATLRDPQGATFTLAG